MNPAYPEQAEVLRIVMLSHNPTYACAKVTLLSLHSSAQPRFNYHLRTPLRASTFSNVNHLYLEMMDVLDVDR